jgi:hypothetical protein
MEKNGDRLNALSKIDGIFNKERGIADFGWCVFFLVFLTGFTFLTIYGYETGNIHKLIAPVDGDYRICGFDKGVEKYPYLYLAKMDSVNPKTIFAHGICVKKCPTKKTD